MILQINNQVRAAPDKKILFDRPETEILIITARRHLDGEKTARLKELVKQKIDWAYLSDAAYRHGVIPLLYHHLSETCSEGVPDADLKQLQSDSQSIALHNLFLTGQLISLLENFKSHEVTAVSFKGATLAKYLYGSISLRHFSDIDILVRREDISKASSLLIEQGFTPQFDITQLRQADFIKTYCQHAFIDKDKIFAVDLHWSLIPPRFSFAPDVELLWEKLQPFDMGGYKVSILSPEDLFVLLCVHGSKHIWGQLNWICDLAEFIRLNDEVDWEAIIEQERAQGSRRMLLLGLYLAGDLLEAPLPAALMQRIEAERPIKSLAASVYKRLFSSRGNRTDFFRVNIFYLNTMTSLKDRVQYSADFVRPTPLEWKLISLPRSLSFLYYILRPLRLTAKYLMRLARRPRSSREINGQ